MSSDSGLSEGVEAAPCVSLDEKSKAKKDLWVARAHLAPTSDESCNAHMLGALVPLMLVHVCGS